MLELGLDLNVWPWVWLVVGVAFLLVELTILGGSLMVLPFGVSALVAAILAFSHVSVAIQWVVFVGGGIILFGVFWRYQSLVQQGSRLPPGVGAARLVGLTAVVTREVDPHDSSAHGEVRVAGETWFARTDGPEVLPPGTTVRITEVEGTRLHVEAVDDTDPRSP